MKPSAAQLRDLIDHLLTTWDEHSSMDELRQPSARKGRRFSPNDIARISTVNGFARHVHETARALIVLVDSAHLNAAIPLVRLMYESALTAVWIVQGVDEGGVKALLHEHARGRQAVQRDARQAKSATFRHGADEVADTETGPFAGSLDSVRSFRDICLDLSPGGVDAYIYYRLFSTYSHASLSATDLYFESPNLDQPGVPQTRPGARVALDASVLLFFACASMVWAARAFTYTSNNRTHRSTLRDAAHVLGVDPEIQLSEHYRLRRQRRRTAPTTQT